MLHLDTMFSCTFPKAGRDAHDPPHTLTYTHKHTHFIKRGYESEARQSLGEYQRKNCFTFLLVARILLHVSTTCFQNVLHPHLGISERTRPHFYFSSFSLFDTSVHVNSLAQRSCRCKYILNGWFTFL